MDGQSCIVIYGVNVQFPIISIVSMQMIFASLASLITKSEWLKFLFRNPGR